MMASQPFNNSFAMWRSLIILLIAPLFASAFPPPIQRTGLTVGTNPPSALGQVSLSARGIANGLSSVTNDGAMFGPDTPSTLTYGTQEAINFFDRWPDIFTSIGGGGIQAGPGQFLLSTNIVLPDQFPWGLRLKGSGWSTRFRSLGSCSTNFPLWMCATNYTILPLTNSLLLSVEDCLFQADQLFPTNFLWSVEGQTFAFFNRCAFVSSYALTNGQGAYTMNYEANVPNAPAGLVGMEVNAIHGQLANANIYIDRCLFYGLACGLIMAPTVGRVHGSYFSDCAIYNELPPPANDLTKLHYCTNLWRGTDGTDYRSWLSSGAAIVTTDGDIQITHNEFFGCGAMATVGLNLAYQGQGEPIVFEFNRRSICKYRLMAKDDNTSEYVVLEVGVTTGGATIQDSQLTNGPGVLLQPNGVALTNKAPLSAVFNNSGSSGEDVSILKIVGDMSISGITSSSIVGTDSNSKLRAYTLSNGLQATAGLLTLSQNLDTTGTPTFAALTVSGNMSWGANAYLTTNMTTTGTALANVAFNKVASVTSGHKYDFDMYLYVSDGLAVDGAKIDFGGGSATASNFRAHVTTFGTSFAFGGQLTSLTGTSGNALLSTDDEMIEVHGSFEPSSTGTFIPRFAKNGNTAGSTLTVYRGSTFRVWEAP